jgi:cobalt-zinc-cadmium efflux system outer membrane protein
MPSHICWRPPLAALLCALASSLPATAVLAEPAPTYRALLEQAQASAPRLAEVRSDGARSEGLARQAAARPNPTLEVDIENVAGGGPFRGTDLAETTAQLEQTLELGGKRPARIAAGRAEVDAARARSVQARADFAFDLADAYAQAEAAERRVELASEAVALAQEDARVAHALVTAGKEADLRAVQARAAVQATRAALDEAQAAAAAAFGKLTALAGSPRPLTSIMASLLDHADRSEAISRPDPLAAPSYLAAQAARGAAARRVRVERTRAVPDVAVRLGVRRFNGDDATALVGGLSVPLPVFDRNRGNVSAAQAELDGAEARLNAARLDAETDVRAATARALAAQSRIAAARESEMAADEAYRLTRIGHQGGKLSLVELNAARRGLTEARAQTLNARLERLSAEAMLARLQGVAPFGDQ